MNALIWISDLDDDTNRPLRPGIGPMSVSRCTPHCNERVCNRPARDGACARDAKIPHVISIYCEGKPDMGTVLYR